jgi:cytochrome c556
MKPLFLAATAAIVTLASGPAAAQFAKPEDAIKYRQSAFTVMASHFGRIAAMAQGKVPFDAQAAAANAAVVSTMARLPFTAFGPGTDKGAPTRAKPAVFTDPKVKDLADKMVAEVGKLDAAARSGNLDAIKAAAGDVGKACKACHDDYRLEKYVTN